MNVAKFNKLFDRYSRDGIVDEDFIRELYKKDKFSFFNNESVSVLIKKNYREILAKCHPFFLSSTVREIYKHNDMREFTLDQFPFLLSLVPDEATFREFNRIFEYKLQKYVNENFSQLVGEIPGTCFYSMALAKDYVTLENKEKLNNYLVEHKKEYVEFLLTNKLALYNSEKDLGSVVDTLVLLVDEILEHENLDYIDIKRLGSGAFSDVIEIGSKVLKVGRKRSIYQIPKTEKLLAPLIRVDLGKISDISGTIEVVEKVETSIGLTKAETQSFYDTLRDNKIVYMDIKEPNLGILLRDNVLHWNKKLALDDTTRGIYGEATGETLKEGDLVIIDSDHLVSEDKYQQLSVSQRHVFNNAFASMFGREYEERQMDEDLEETLGGKKIR